MTLTDPQRQLLLAVAGGRFLKAHRDIDGHKTFLLHPLQGEPQAVEAGDVETLCDLGLLDSNKKFPAATFWLTESGRALTEEMGHG